MTAAPAAGAASHATVDWHAIDWPTVHANVRRLQARIVQATRAGRWGKVKALQRLLTHSFSGKALAVRRVTENRGKHTPGVDGATWSTPAQKTRAVQTLRQRGYRPRPLRRVYIPKRNGKRRPLGIPTMTDRAMQALYLLALDPIAETTGDRNSYGFRRERSTADAMTQCFLVLGRCHSTAWVLEGDITSCFDRISHDWLLAHVPMETALLRTWLTAGYVDHGTLFPTDDGTPQGGPISPVLANLTLDGLERVLTAHFPPTHTPATNPKVNLVRYADDFIITGRSRELLEDEVRPLVEAFLRERGLALSAEKTRVTHIDEGVDFLGHTVRRYRTGRRHTVLITPSRASVKAFLGKIRTMVKSNKQARAGNLVLLLNPIIRGWALYHRHQASKATFHAVDHAIFWTLWRWAKRRHRNKSTGWIRAKYFQTHGTRHWVFTGEGTDARGRRRIVRLLPASAVPIRRHPKIHPAANPYDPAWAGYFARRHGVQTAQLLTGQHRVLALWDEQHGRCLVCRQPLLLPDGWHSHHLVWRSHGGSDAASNRVLLHPTCHQQVHSRGLTVEKPRPSQGGESGLSRVTGNFHARF